MTTTYQRWTAADSTRRQQTAPEGGRHAQGGGRATAGEGRDAASVALAGKGPQGRQGGTEVREVPGRRRECLDRGADRAAHASVSCRLISFEHVAGSPREDGPPARSLSTLSRSVLVANKQEGRRVTSARAPSPTQHHPLDASAIVADPDDWGPCERHPARASAGFVGCSATWPPPEDSEPRCDSARLAEESAEYGSLGIAIAFATLEHRLAEGGGPR